jgi:8-oxo-dGTP pyrophosphatase MutT (NUDIX family)
MSASDDLPVAGTVVILRPSDEGIEVLLMKRPDRGSFASAWVFPGGRVEPSDALDGRSEQDAATRAGIREVGEEVGLVVTDLVPLSLWTPPVVIPTRIRTWFFLTHRWSGEVRPSADEVAETVWISPSAALSLHAAEEWVLFPPTWMTLHELSTVADVDAAMATPHALRTFATRIDGTSFRWDGLRLETASLPWTLAVEQAP